METTEDVVPAWIRARVLPAIGDHITSLQMVREAGSRKSAMLFTGRRAYLAEKSLLSGVKITEIDYPAGLFVNLSKCPHCGRPIRQPARKVAVLAQGGKAVPPPATKRPAGLTPKQIAQRKYAARMRGIRKRAAKAAGGGRSPVAERTAARELRKKLGLKRVQ